MSRQPTNHTDKAAIQQKRPRQTNGVTAMHIHTLTRRSLLTLVAILIACLAGPGCLTPDLRAEEGTPVVGRVPRVAEAATEDEELDRALAYLAAGIAEPIRDGEQAKIAVLDFVDLNGRTTRLGMFLAEELITRLFETGQFEVVERRLLTKVLKEQNLSESGLIEAKSAMTLGSILGVKAIVVGTVADLGTKLKVNARVISAQTGALTSAAQANINKNEDVARLYEAVVDSDGTAPPDKSQDGSVTDGGARQGYHQDFSNVEEGLLPPEFIAGDDIGVVENKGKRYLTTFVRGTTSS